VRYSTRISSNGQRADTLHSVAKLFSTPPGKQALDRSDPPFMNSLRNLLADSNPTVVANAVAALVEIAERSDEIAMKLNITVASKLVTALGECSEWGQIYILDALLSYTPLTSLDAETMAERIVVRLQHTNSAVVLTTVKVILYLMNYMESDHVIATLERKMGPPLGDFDSSPIYEATLLTPPHVLLSHSPLLRARGPVRRAPQHPPHHPAQASDSSKRG
jgi:vesicle coat complex subunit